MSDYLTNILEVNSGREQAPGAIRPRPVSLFEPLMAGWGPSRDREAEEPAAAEVEIVRGPVLPPAPAAPPQSEPGSHHGKNPLRPPLKVAPDPSRRVEEQSERADVPPASIREGAPLPEDIRRVPVEPGPQESRQAPQTNTVPAGVVRIRLRTEEDKPEPSLELPDQVRQGEEGTSRASFDASSSREVLTPAPRRTSSDAKVSEEIAVQEPVEREQTRRSVKKAVDQKAEEKSDRRMLPTRAGPLLSVTLGSVLEEGGEVLPVTETREVSKPVKPAVIRPGVSSVVVPEPADTNEPVIQVTIGRIEVRAPASARSVDSQTRPTAPPILSLEEHLRQRSGGWAR